MMPPVPYFGGKVRIAETIASLLPRHEHYVEPFCGSLSVLLAKPASVYETVNDLDQALMTFWRVLRDRPADLARVCALTPHSRAEQQAAYDLAGVDELEAARRVWVQLTQGRSGTRRRTGWRHYVRSTGGATSLPDYLLGYLDRIMPAAERISAVSLECRPALELIERYATEPDVLLYVDPPYLGTTRTRSPDGYVHDLRTEAEHRDLAAALHGARAAVVISGYPAALYDMDLYTGWYRHEIRAFTGQGRAGYAPRTEVLWSNRTIGAQDVLDFTDAGVSTGAAS